MSNLFYVLADVTCGGFTMDSKIPDLVSKAILLIQIAVPILLIIFGMLDLGKAVIAQKEDEIKKGQQTFVKRLVAAVIVFFVIVIVKLVVNLVAPDHDKTGIQACLKCFTEGTNSCGRSTSR